MHDLKLLSMPALLDQLVEQTALYLGMIHGRGTIADLQECRELMTGLQLEIESRKVKQQVSE
jgi:hypothetical protein